MDERLEEILRGFKKLNIAVVGDSVLDKYIKGEINRLNPDKKSVGLLRASKRSIRDARKIPGAAANVANNIIRFANCDFYGVVGEDSEGREINNALKERGINSKLVFDGEIDTIVKNRYYDSDESYLWRLDEEEENPIPIDEGVQRQILEDLKKNIGNYQGVLISDYDKGMFVRNSRGKELGSRIVELANSHRIPVVVDAKSKNIDYFKGCTVVCPNRKEAGEIVGRGPLTNRELLEGGRKIQQIVSCKYVLITCDKDGVFIFNDGESKMLGTYAREVSDHTGAGDTLISGVALGLAYGLDIYEAGNFGNMIAGIVCEKTGTATTNPKEVLERYSDVKI